MQRKTLLFATAATAALAAGPALAGPAHRALVRRGDATIEYTDRGSGPAIVMVAGGRWREISVVNDKRLSYISNDLG